MQAHGAFLTEERRRVQGAQGEAVALCRSPTMAAVASLARSSERRLLCSAGAVRQPDQPLLVAADVARRARRDHVVLRPRGQQGVGRVQAHRHLGPAARRARPRHPAPRRPASSGPRGPTRQACPGPGRSCCSLGVAAPSALEGGLARSRRHSAPPRPTVHLPASQAKLRELSFNAAKKQPVDAEARKKLLEELKAHPFNYASMQAIQADFCKVTKHAGDPSCLRLKQTQAQSSMQEWYCAQPSSAQSTWCKRTSLLKKLHAMPAGAPGTADAKAVSPERAALLQARPPLWSSHRPPTDLPPISAICPIISLASAAPISPSSPRRWTRSSK